MFQYLYMITYVGLLFYVQIILLSNRVCVQQLFQKSLKLRQNGRKLKVHFRIFPKTCFFL